MARREEEARLEMMMKEAEKAKNGEKRFTFKTKRWMHDPNITFQLLRFASEAHVFSHKRKRKRSHHNTRTKWGRMASIFKLSFY